jgi:hypothetical protein
MRHAAQARRSAAHPDGYLYCAAAVPDVDRASGMPICRSQRKCDATPAKNRAVLVVLNAELAAGLLGDL